MLPQKTDPKDGCHLEPCRKIVALCQQSKEPNTNSFKQSCSEINYPHPGHFKRQHTWCRCKFEGTKIRYICGTEDRLSLWFIPPPPDPHDSSFNVQAFLQKYLRNYCQKSLFVSMYNSFKPHFNLVNFQVVHMMVPHMCTSIYNFFFLFTNKTHTFTRESHADYMNVFNHCFFPNQAHGGSRDYPSSQRVRL